MPVDKFGRNSNVSNSSGVSNGVSLSYINKNYQRKNEVSDTLKTYVNKAVVDEVTQQAAQSLELQKRVESTEKFIQETIVPKIILPQTSLSKPLITIWAEAYLILEADKFEWSFGSSSRIDRSLGYVMLTPGRILRMGLSVSATSEDEAGVQLVVNGETYGSYSVYKGQRRNSVVEVFARPLSVNEGDVINFKTLLNTDGNIGGGVVNLLIELDL